MNTSDDGTNDGTNPSPPADEPAGYRPKVDEQDGGPGSHTDDGGNVNDVASGGVSEERNEDDKDMPDSAESDVYDRGDTQD